MVEWGARAIAYAPNFARNYEAILSEIDSLRTGRPTAIRVTSADDPFVGWSEAPSKTFGVQFYRQVAEAETKVACAAATRHGAVCVDYLHIFGGADGTQTPPRSSARTTPIPAMLGSRPLRTSSHRSVCPS